ncbi:hypothetical protein C3L33_09096, partial [Rhododendron williamsianum]
MFSSGSDTGHDNSGVSGPVLIPMRFVWPYGGRRVFLSGTFTSFCLVDEIRAWVLFSLNPQVDRPYTDVSDGGVAVCVSGYLQRITRISPGFMVGHQFKFFVDGEWRHDERQPFETGNYGVVNTVYLATENDEIPGIYNPETPGGCNMEVDNDMFHRLEPVPRISEADINISRHRISVFLSTHTAYELLPESGKIVALDVNLPVKQAFHILYEQGIPVAPLWDFCKAQFVGVLSALDFILILKEQGGGGLGKHRWSEEALEVVLLAQPCKPCLRQDSASTKPTLQEQSRIDYPSANLALPLKNKRIIKDATIVFTQPCKRRCMEMVDFPLHLSICHLMHNEGKASTSSWAGPYDTLKDVASKILQNKVGTVPVIHSSSQDASFPQLLHLASLSGILKCICRHFRHSSGSLPILQQPICSLSLGSWVPKIGESNGQPFAMLRPNASLSAALSLLVEGIVIYSFVIAPSNAADVSSIPIVDDNDSLLDIYCRSDITALAKDRAYAQIRLEEMSINQVMQFEVPKALQLGQDVSSPFGFFSGQRCQMCLRSDSLHKVMERLANPGVRRLVIVEAGSKRVEGIVSLSDVFKFLLG